MIAGPEQLSFQERLWEPGLSSLEERRLRLSLIKLYKYLKGGRRENGARLFAVAPGDRARGSEWVQD